MTVVAGCAPCQARANLAAAPTPDTPPPAPAAPFTGPATRWAGPLMYENQVTGEMPRRVFKPNALYWDNEPMPLSRVATAGEGHDGSVVVGRIDTVTRGSKGAIDATGDFDMGSPDGQEAARLVAEDRFNWASVVIDDMVVEVWVSKDLMAEDPSLLLAAAGDPIPSQDGYEVVATLSPDDEIHVVTSARLRGATLVETSAISNARIRIDTASEMAATPPAPADAPADMPGMMPDGETECSCTEGAPGYDPGCVCSETATVTASATGTAPPASWFADPGLTEPTPLVVTDEGRVYGHLAIFGQCHVAFADQCVQPPRSASSYAYFHTGTVRTADGPEVPTGVITLDTTHAGPPLTPVQTLAHYENTGRGIADVHVGEDRHGVWIAGALRPGVAPEVAHRLRASPLSGDWRRIGGNLELIAALAVNVPGFPILRPKSLAAGGQVRSLVAAGVLRPPEPRSYKIRVPAPVPSIDPAHLAARVNLSRFAVAQRHPVRSVS